MEIKFDGKRALVTGAGKGIGRSVAKALHMCGAEVFALSRTQTDLDSLQQEVPGIKVIAADISDWEDTRKKVESLGAIDLLVNNAGVVFCEPFMDVKPDHFDKNFNVNVKAVINVSQVVAKTMIDRGCGGAIVNVSSQASLRALPNHTVYCGTKAALDAVTKCMALELGPHQIRVNCVNPTVVMTTLSKKVWNTEEKCRGMLSRLPLGHFAEEEDCTHAILFLLSDKSAMIHGAQLPVDGGFWAC